MCLTIFAISLILASWTPSTAQVAPGPMDETDDVYDLIVQLNPHLDPNDPIQLPMKFRSLARGPYDYFRGTAEMFGTWCRTHCADWLNDAQSKVLLHGDVHPGNIGTYRSPDESGLLHFSLVDFDEVFEGPFQLDLLRAAVSLRLAADECGVETSEKKWLKLCERLCASYAAAFEVGVDDSRLQSDFPIVGKLLRKAAEEDSAAYFDKFVNSDGASLRFRRVAYSKGAPVDLLDPVPPAVHAALVAETEKFVARAASVKADRKTEPNPPASRAAIILDTARWTRLGSSGSQGVAKYLVLLRDPTGGERSLLMLQYKEQPSPAAARAGLIAAMEPAARAKFVADAHAILQCHASDWIGSAVLDGRGYLIRPKGPWAKEPSQKDLDAMKKLEAMADLLGALLGRGHRSSITVSGDPRVKHIPGAARALSAELNRRALAARDRTRADYDKLRSDPRFAANIERADRHVEKQSQSNR